MKYLFQKSNISGQLLLAAFAFLLFTFSFQSCGNLEKEIDLDLPVYTPQYVVECYLEPGQPFTLLLTRSSSFFDPFPTDPLEYVEDLLVDSAEVIITHDGVEYPLANAASINPATFKVFNYSNPALVPTDFDNDFSLKITMPDGKTITATTRLLPVVPIDSVVVEFDDEQDTLARCLTYLTDDPTTVNFYRRMIHHNSLIDSVPDQDFATNDDFVDDKILVFGTGYDFKEGDTIYNAIYHIDRPYYDFFNSLQFAIDANGNPFGQPSSIISNLEGDANALGIFTGLNYDRVMTIVKK
ncbi:MAG: DUF4249 domain-containing protein [Saprospiraceae bacterium]|jgi:hypothetical protein|nr:DUF4249 domain-containing protein [Saprospiraceae bacterium]